VSSECERLKVALRDRYSVERELGAGGTSTVYLAVDLKHHRKVAIKVLKSELTVPLGPERFLREIDLAAKLSHPHILPLYDSGEAEGLLYYVMPYVEGESLRERLDREKQLPIEQALQFALEVADGLTYAHSLGIVHRDVKPGNILLYGGHAVLADFGVARALSLVDTSPLTVTGTAVGTLAYMSPEQACGHEVDASTDTYALGCVVYEMLVGEPPYTGPTPGAALARKLVEPVPSLRVVRGVVPLAVERAVLRALARTPADRFASPLDFAKALQSPVAPPGDIGPTEHRTPAALTPRIESLVVLPLDNLSGDPGQEYFVEGMHEAIIGELARIGAFLVISRTSAKCYHHTDKPVPQIARELNVDAVVEGSVLRVEGRVRITLQLVEGREDRHLWSQSYERDLRDILALQRDVARAVAGEIQMAVTPAELARPGTAGRPGGTPGPDPQAYDAYLKGRYHFARWGQGESAETVIRYYEEAISKDRRFAPAYAALAEALLQSSYALPQRHAQGREAAERAVELDPFLPEAHATLAMALNQHWDWEQSEAEFHRALELDPNSSMAHQWYAQLLRDMMRNDEALREAQRARDLDPLSLPAFTMVGWVLTNQHRYDEALSLWKEVLELDPDYALAVYNQGLVYAIMGKGAEVVSTAREVAERWGDSQGQLYSTLLLCVGYALNGQRELASKIIADFEAQNSPPSWIALLYLVLGEQDTALQWLEAACEQRYPGLPSDISEPWFDNLRDHPRFRALRAKIGL
jgi:TolB-like protein/tetratricopeptide (TPR) repeat protein